MFCKQNTNFANIEVTYTKRLLQVGPYFQVSNATQRIKRSKKKEYYEDEYGNQHESVETNIIRFETETSGRMEYKYVTATQNENDSYPFTYTYSTPNGTFTISEGGETETFNFSYNANNNTLALYGSGGYYMMFSRLQE